MADLIRYDLLVQDALRGVVRQVLTEVARNGLQGEHHFFITFKTATPGLRLSNRMRERYPDEMTIILQHQFWGLSVTDPGFEVGLSFNNTPERLFVPFAAITMFQDPSVNFGLKFDVREAAAPLPDPQHKPVVADGPKAVSGKRSLAAVDSDNGAPPAVTEPGRKLAESKPVAVKPVEAKGKPAQPEKPRPVLAKVSDRDNEVEGEHKGGGTKVISIDSFRKKP